jgi:glycogen debranching enzyme
MADEAARQPQPGRDEGYQKALEVLHECATPAGFVAAPTQRANYRRIWARDGSILSLAALLTGDADLIEAARATLETLAGAQGPHGEIPSNVDPQTRRTSYGGTTGRVDGDLWFIIACGEYWAATGDDAFLERTMPTIEKVVFLLGAWEYNSRGLLWVPCAGDWADEYVHQGYVLYDEVLYLQAQRALARFHSFLHESTDHTLEEKSTRLRHMIRANFWFDGDNEPPPDAYHETMWSQGRRAAAERRATYWMPYFSPMGYGYRFDAFANVLVSLFDVADDEQRSIVDDYICDELLNAEMPLLPAFHPVIEPVDAAWDELQSMFTYTFRNQPYEYQNGGLWPLITGFYVADLATRGKDDRAARLLDALHTANSLPYDGEPWSFPEYLDGKTLQPDGAHPQGWSAAAAVIGHHAVAGDGVFRIGVGR